MTEHETFGLSAALVQVFEHAQPSGVVRAGGLLDVARSTLVALAVGGDPHPPLGVGVPDAAGCLELDEFELPVSGREEYPELVAEVLVVEHRRFVDARGVAKPAPEEFPHGVVNGRYRPARGDQSPVLALAECARR